MSSDETSPAAGWYPVQGVGERYWDGEAWTPRTRPSQDVPTASEPAPAVIPAQPPIASQQVDQHATSSDDAETLVQPPLSPSQAAAAPGSDQSPEPPKTRSRKKLLAIVVAVVLVLGVGGGGAYAYHRHQVAVAHDQAVARARAAAAKRAAEAKAKAEAEAAAKAAELKEQRATYQSCRRQLMPLYNSLSSIDSRLNVGLTQAELGTAVGDASIAYDRISIHRLGKGTCLSSGAKLEDAFNQYAKTSSSWNDCITDLYCDTDSILPGMQAKWSVATRDLANAKRLMQKLNPDSPLFESDASGSLNS